jgi:hypothetical protein
MNLPNILIGPAGEIAATIAASRRIMDLKPVKDVIRASDKFTEVEKTLLLTLAEEREDMIAAHHLGKTHAL